VGARARLALAAAALCAATACEFNEHPVAPTASRAIVHAVLNPNASTYTVLVEELLTGQVDIDTDIPFQEADPIRTGSGEPIHNALVVIRNAFGDSAIGVEDQLPTGGTGVYRFTADVSFPGNPSALALYPGVSYELRVETPSGAVVTGSTTIPLGVWQGASFPTPFNRDSDTLSLSWTGAQGEKTYLLRVNTPRGPYHIFTDSLSIHLPGSLRNFFSERLPSVFVPGFTQTLQISAIDINLYDYYRSQNNPFTGSGLINHLEGGTGLFGSLVPLKMLTVETTAGQELPVEGQYVGSPGFTSGAPATMSLYVDARHGDLALITGNYERESLPGRRGLIGFLDGSSIGMAFLREELASDTTATFSGTLYGRDSIVGTVRATGERLVYLKVP